MDTAAARLSKQPNKIFSSQNISTPVAKMLRSARRGSALRRHTLQRLKREQSINLVGQQRPLLLGDADRSLKQGEVLQSSGNANAYRGKDDHGDASTPKGELMSLNVSLKIFYFGHCQDLYFTVEMVCSSVSENGLGTVFAQ